MDELLLKCNVHKCIPKNKKTRVAQGTSKTYTTGPKGCLDEDGDCLARFPRVIQLQTFVDKLDGRIDVKKLESMLNTFVPLITFLFRCNTDASSLLSGSAMKAAVAYVTDYITKQVLKSYHIFQIAYDVLVQGSSGVIGSTEGARNENCHIFVPFH